VLIDQAREKAEKMEEMIRKRTTLEDAIDDYRKMTGGAWDPPRGFDKWWMESHSVVLACPLIPCDRLDFLRHRYHFASSHNSLTLPSLIPQAHLSVLPFLAYPGSTLRQRAEILKDQDAIWRLTVTKDDKKFKYKVDGKAARSGRAGCVFFFFFFLSSLFCPRICEPK
jgi:hypothetical protein